ncbi:unnamed protein product [Fraxinus pennsylvanica]|uniref:beta-galactosidase n=1 Tax=Fraxinus pennsylvanica TaxID=56036 RepID=A0AAD2DRB0_9LAMI|nr:unnamed protein product [Fraxinus pennsylvanica]
MSYQYHGGTNFGHTSGGPFITTSYDYDAPIDEYGLVRQPKYDHLKGLHRAIKLREPALVSADPTVMALGNYEQLMESFETMPFSRSNTNAMNMDNSSKVEYGHLIKLSRSSQNPSPSLVNQWNSEDDESPMPSSQYNLLVEPSPLGLQLNKTQIIIRIDREEALRGI